MLLVIAVTVMDETDWTPRRQSSPKEDPGVRVAAGRFPSRSWTTSPVTRMKSETLASFFCTTIRPSSKSMSRRMIITFQRAPSGRSVKRRCSRTKSWRR